MKTENELIAEFMGLDIDGNRVTDGQQETTLDKLKYDTSWDWLMPVVEKIANLHSKFPFEVSEFCNDYGIAAKKEVVYRAVVDFIRWYNSQNS